MAGLLTHPPARVIAQFLVDLGLGVEPDERDPAAWSVYYGSEPPSPDEVITVRGTTGTDEGTTMTDGVLQERYGLQVRIRSLEEDAGDLKARTIATTLHPVTNRWVNLDGTEYLVSNVDVVGGVLPLGKSQVGTSLNLFTINLLALIDLTP